MVHLTVSNTLHYISSLLLYTQDRKVGKNHGTPSGTIMNVGTLAKAQRADEAVFVHINTGNFTKSTTKKMPKDNNANFTDHGRNNRHFSYMTE